MLGNENGNGHPADGAVGGIIPLKDIPTETRLESLEDIHKLMAQMDVAGEKLTTIAESTSTHPARIRQIREEPLYKVYVQELLKEKRNFLPEFPLEKEISRLKHRAISTVENLMETSKVDVVRLNAAKEILDRESPKVNRTQNENLTMHLDSKVLQEAIQMMAGGQVISPSASMQDIVEILEEEEKKDES